MKSKDPAKESTFHVIFRLHSWSNKGNMNSTIFRSLMFLSLSLLIFTNGVFGDETEDVSVMEGNSVMLHTGVEKQKDDLIVWSFGPEKTIVAKVNGKANSMRIYDRVAGRGTLNNQTGSLNITNIKTTDSGLYHLKISSKYRVSHKTFNVIVFESETLQVSISNQTEPLDINEPCQPSSCLGTTRLPMILIVMPPLVVCLIIILVVVVYIRKHRGGYQKAPLMKTGHPEKHKIQEQV